MSKQNYSFHDREISWLAFNARLLQEAEDDSVPLIERFKFLGIYSNNLDEFFRVRVPTVQKMSAYGQKAIPVLGFDPEATLQKITEINDHQQERFEEIYKNLKDELRYENIFFLNEKDLNEFQLEEIKQYFINTVQHALVPVMLSEDRELPELNGKAIYLAIKLYNLDNTGKAEIARYALLEIPSAIVSRFYVMVDDDGRKNIILLDDIIRCNLKEIFAIFQYQELEAYTIKITRDAELDIEDDVTSGIMERLAISLKNRKKGDPVRLVHDKNIPKDLLKFLVRKVGMESNDVIVAGGRYHNFKDYMDFPRIGNAQLRYPSLSKIKHIDLEGERSMFEVLKKKDVLLNFPYQSYGYFIALLREAAIDPAVESIKITVYRLVSKNSKVIHSLINAARNGKHVTVVVELKARFDEESNMNYAHQLQDEGVRVIFGTAGLKVHSKILVIKRKEDDGYRRYSHIGTGNFHEGTANLYCDHSLLTSDKSIGSEVNKIFKFFNDNYKRYIFRELLVAPFNLKPKILKMIDREIKNKQAGKEAFLIIKLNNLQDRELATKLYEASQAGVNVRLIVRSINCVINGLKEFSEYIEAISIVDRFLEHSRILVFGNDGDPKVYIGSADWMVRNMHGRVEVMTPIYDPDLKAVLLKELELQWNDNTKARLWNNALNNAYQENDQDEIRSQYAFYDYLRSINNEIVPEIQEPSLNPS